MGSNKISPPEGLDTTTLLDLELPPAIHVESSESTGSYAGFAKDSEAAKLCQAALQEMRAKRQNQNPPVNS